MRRRSNVSSSFFGAALSLVLATVVVHAPRAALTLEIASTDAQRQHGLMDRTAVAAHTGMIFVFDRDEPVAFWMKDTLVSLDMVFVGAGGGVRRVFANVPVVSPTLPDEQIPREAADAKFVIELPAGEAAQDGITPGVWLDLRGVPPSE